MSNYLKSPLKWYGGKTNFVSKLLPLIPEHLTYVEVFAGSAALFFAKPVSSLEVINDLDSDLVNFFTVLRDPEKYERFQLLVSLTPYSREEYLNCQETYRDGEDDVDRARRFFVAVRQAYSATLGKSWSYSKTGRKSGRSASSLNGYLGAIDRLPEIVERLREAQIEHKDFRDLVRAYDGPDTLFYLDPPYVPSTRKCSAYVHEMTHQDHEELVELLLGIKGKAMLSGYRNGIYVPLEDAGWERYDFRVRSFAPLRKKDNGSDEGAGTSDNHRRVESVWLKS
jgi:DNA adenine methylase